MKLSDELKIVKNNEKKNNFTINLNITFYKNFSFYKNIL